VIAQRTRMMALERSATWAGATMKRLNAYGYGALVAAALASPMAVQAGGLVTVCTKLDICYCVNSHYQKAITENVARVRKLIADNKAQGKAIGYLSIPLSPAGGGSFAINFEISPKGADKLP